MKMFVKTSRRAKEIKTASEGREKKRQPPLGVEQKIK